MIHTKKSRIREAKNLSTDTKSSPDTKKNPPSKAKLVEEKNIKIERQFYTLYGQKFSNLRPILTNTFPQGFQKSKQFEHWILGSGSKKIVKRSERKKTPLSGAKFAQKQTFFCGDFIPFIIIFFNLRPRLLITFPKGFQISKNKIDIPL